MSNLPNVERDQGDFVLRARARIDQPRAKVFEFFANARNLERLTPDFLQFKVLTPGEIEMRQGALIDYKLRVRRIPIRWRTEITAWDPPYSFEDNQLKGPYRKWLHKHIFEEDGHSTIMEDIVRYRVWGGRLVNSLLVQRDVQKIFEYRSSVLSSFFPTESTQ